MSTWCHSRDKFSQAFPIFHCFSPPTIHHYTSHGNVALHTLFQDHCVFVRVSDKSSNRPTIDTMSNFELLSGHFALQIFLPLSKSLCAPDRILMSVWCSSITGKTSCQCWVKPVVHETGQNKLRYFCCFLLLSLVYRYPICQMIQI